jgi:hypothetical protein
VGKENARHDSKVVPGVEQAGQRLVCRPLSRPAQRSWPLTVVEMPSSVWTLTLEELLISMATLEML